MNIYLVGGAVRDQLMGLSVKERDWVVVGASPEELLSQGFQQVGKDFPVFLHPKTKEEYALARTEVKTGAGYYGFKCRFSSSVTLEEDLMRRDLTINAMAMDDKGLIIDPYSGRKDIDDKVFRHVSGAFVEDPLRVLRVARFAARFPDFNVSHETRELMRSMVKELEALPKERIWKELSRALEMAAPWRFFEELGAVGALECLYLNKLSFSSEFKVSCQQLTGVEQRFAALFLTSQIKDIKQCSKAVCATSLAKNLALLSHDAYSFLALDEANSPVHQWAWLKRADAFRRPDRFRSSLEVVLERKEVNEWMNKLEALSQIDARSLMDKGLTGKALGDAIKQAQIALLTTLN
ncbi:MAG TPA: hypothetical protein QF353_00060 [Gammaproteobacteria bacterium]|nr:hypothetical protein [Gammaproteobacteria bacterium]